MASRSGRMGRPQKPYHPSWGGDPIPGLYKCPDGRWRINVTGQKFTEPDERRAIQRFRDWQSQQGRECVEVPFATTDEAGMQQAAEVDLPVTLHVEAGEKPSITFHRLIPADEFWPWLREILVTYPEYVAKMTGLPELAGLRHLPLPKPSIKLADLVAVYQQDNPSTDHTKRQAVNTFQTMTEWTGAVTLDDLTQECLLEYRRRIESSVAPATRVMYYSCIKRIISFGLKVAMDQTQIRAALDRCKVLWTGEAMPSVSPKPISRDHFHKLLGQAGAGPWRAWLLCGLNLCMTVEELCGLEWDSFDLDAGTFATIRAKTKRKRIPRAATLWPETVAELRKIKRTGSPFVFTSKYGTRYNRNTRLNDFKDLREAAGLPESVTFSTLRDGAYGVACQATTDERWARVLAGHGAAGYTDNYVLRNPEVVRPACEAVYKAYGPFPGPAPVEVAA